MKGTVTISVNERRAKEMLAYLNTRLKTIADEFDALVLEKETVIGLIQKFELVVDEYKSERIITA
jgi:hypothetical protein